MSTLTRRYDPDPRQGYALSVKKSDGDAAEDMVFGVGYKPLRGAGMDGRLALMRKTTGFAVRADSPSTNHYSV